MNHTFYMKRALKLAEKGRGFTNPNPLVGALIVKDEQIIAEGYHAKYGEAHAEINAFNAAKTDVEGATMYVTLEPCSHQGKTPPCADAIIKKGIAHVVIASQDPNPLVAGRGIKRLKDANIKVTTDILDEENQQLNAPFFHHIQTQTPYVVMKTAMSADGKIATKSHDSRWISNAKSRALTHQLRHDLQAIMVGVGTVIHDNPTLNTRHLTEPLSHPTIIIADSLGDIPLDARVLKQTTSPVIVAVTPNAKKDRINAIEAKGAEVLVVPEKDGDIDLTLFMKALGQKPINSILLEGGATLNDAAIRAGIVQKIYSFVAPLIIGGQTAPTPVGGLGYDTIKAARTLSLVSVDTIDEDVLIVYEMRD